MKRLKIIAIAIAVLLIAAQDITFFVVPNSLGLYLGNAFWTSFVFANIGFVSATVILLLALSDKKDSVIHTGALLAVTYSYVAAEIVLANLFVYLPNMKFIPTLLSQLAAFVVYLATILMVMLGIFWKEKVNKEVKEKVNYINSLELVVTKTILLVEDKDIKKKLESFKEKVHYSDPMSNEACKDEEAKLSELAGEMLQKAAEKKEGEIPALVLDAEKYLTIRNQVCLSTK